MKIRPYRAVDAQAWDALVDASINGTFLHTRRFLSYHGERFADLSCVVELDGTPAGVFPAARDPADADCACSHPGLTYGGLVHDGVLQGARMIEAMQAIAAHYCALGLARIRYKAVPHFYHRRPAAGDLYALFRLGARRYRCDLSSTLDLAQRGPRTHGREQAFAKAQRTARIEEGAAWLAPFWDVLAANLAARHATAPVHSLAEIRHLMELFPDRISCRVACAADNRVLAGAVLFHAPPALHCQYLAASDEGRESAALDYVIEASIADAVREKMRWFDFGTSTRREGLELNEGLFNYKASFGAGSTVHEFYEVDLDATTGGAHDAE